MALSPRKDMDPRFQWDLTDIFPSQEAWEKSYQQAGKAVEALSALPGTLHGSKEQLKAGLDRIYAAIEPVSLLYLYATLQKSGDNGDPEAQALEAEKGYTMREDAGRGWRRGVASPMPRRIVEIDQVRQLWDNTIVVTCGGGGIPVVENPDGPLEGVAAVIDKDFAAELLAEQVGADVLMILTEVEQVAIHFGKPEQENLRHMSLSEAAQYVAEGHFAPGSMLPKVEAAMKFVRANPNKVAIITSLNKAMETVVTFAKGAQPAIEAQ